MKSFYSLEFNSKLSNILLLINIGIAIFIFSKVKFFEIALFYINYISVWYLLTWKYTLWELHKTRSENN